MGGIIPYGWNFIGEQLKDNPFNPSSGGSNFEWVLKNKMKIDNSYQRP
jgi:hypothetical protein